MPPKTQPFVPQYAAGLLIFADAQILAVSRQNKGSRKKPHDWGLPAGHAAVFERPYETAVRELREETGLTALRVKPLITVPPEVTGGLPFHVYLPDGPVIGKPFRETREGLVSWVTLARFLNVVDLEKSVVQSNRFILRYGLGSDV